MTYDLSEILSQTKSLFLTTKDLAELVTVKPQTLLKSYSAKGHYRGLVPVKQNNTRLMWKKSDVQTLIESGGVKS